MRAPRRAWQPELALVLLIPLGALLGGVATLRVAGGDLSDAGAGDGTKRIAQVQTAQLGPDLAAARAGLSARLQVDRARQEIRVRVAGAAADAGLRIEFEHGLRADRDQHALLRRRGEDWVAAFVPGEDSRWHVQLVDGQRHWRLVGTLARGGDSASLQPALAAP
jgi:hypothetical protein